MIVGNFNNTKPINILFLSIVLSFFAWFGFFTRTDLYISSNLLLNILLTWINFMVFNSVTKKGLCSSENDFSILFYVLLSGLFYYTTLDTNFLIANIFILIALNELMQIDKNDIHAKAKLFNFGFFIGLASLIFSLNFLFLLLGIVGILVFNKLSWRTLIIPLIGFVVPFFFVFVVYDLFKIEITTITFPYFNFNYSFSNLISKIITIYLILLIIWSLVRISSRLNMELTNYKKYHFLVIFYLIIALIILLFSEKRDQATFIYIIPPLSVVFANALPTIHKKWLANSILFVGIILIILNYSF